MNRVTASASERLLQCPGHARLPWVRTESEAAAEGTRLHAIMERADYDAEPQTHAAHQRWTEWLRSSGYDVTSGHVEQPVAIDTETRRGRLLMNAAHRDYSSATRREVPGTIDLLAIVEGEGRTSSLAVVDWKFGREPVAADSAQLRTLAAAAMLAPEYAHITWALCIIVQAPAGQEATIEVRGYPREELVAHVEMLGDALNEVTEGAVNLQRGDACKYCPAEASCPAQLASLSALVAPAGPGPITPERAGAIWLELRQAKKRLEAIEDACKAMAAELPQGLPLPGGRRLVATTRSRTTVDAKALEAVAREHGATSEEIATCARTTTYSTTQETKQ